MHARGYETISTRIHSGAIVLSKLDVPQGCNTLNIIAVSLVTSLLDWLPSRGKYIKVIHCDIYSRLYSRHFSKLHSRALFKALFKAMFRALLKALFKGVKGVRVILGFRVPITSVNGEGQRE